MSKRTLGIILIAIPVLGYFVGAFFSLGLEVFLQLLGIIAICILAAAMIIAGLKLIGK